MEALDKEKMLDSKGRPITQGLFLETSYGNTKNVMYTLKPRDYVYKGKKLPSIKRLFLEFDDPTEYYFAYEYFLDWDHWQRIKANKLIADKMEGWQEELEVRSAANGILAIRDMAYDEDKPNYQAAKFIAKREWHTRGAGRPSKAEIARETRIAAKIDEEFEDDMRRISR